MNANDLAALPLLQMNGTRYLNEIGDDDDNPDDEAAAAESARWVAAIFAQLNAQLAPHGLGQRQFIILPGATKGKFRSIEEGRVLLGFWSRKEVNGYIDFLSRLLMLHNHNGVHQYIGNLEVVARVADEANSEAQFLVRQTFVMGQGIATHRLKKALKLGFNPQAVHEATVHFVKQSMGIPYAGFSIDDFTKRYDDVEFLYSQERGLLYFIDFGAAITPDHLPE